MQQQISDYLKALLKELKDANDKPILGSVFAEVPGENTKAASPVAMILPAESPSEYGTTAQNDRFEGFTIYVLIPLEDGSSRKQAWKNIRMISDKIRNGIDDTEDLGGLRSEDGKSRVMGVKPTSAGTQLADDGSGETLICEISVTVKYTYNFR